MYHKVSSFSSLAIPALNFETFRRQIDFIRKFYEVVPLNNILDTSSKINITRIAITFDDGYDCVYKFAYPILKKYKLPATIFLAVDCIEKNIPIWPDLISYYIFFTKKLSIELIVENQKIRFDLLNVKKKMETAKNLKEILKNVQNNYRLILIKELKFQLEVDDPKEESLQMLSWKDVREMSENSINFGTHTMTHPILTKMPLEEARKEILESKRIIEEKTGKAVSTFAYPNGEIGDFNQDIKKILQESKYILACTTLFGSNDKNTNPFELKRIYTSGDSLLKFILRLEKAKWTKDIR
jgi:peptidoglycan/xylan/chitin deacetylase (PgdA/CDA1 family)